MATNEACMRIIPLVDKIAQLLDSEPEVEVRIAALKCVLLKPELAKARTTRGI